jgi:DnaJ homolog subfamily B member 6
MAPGESRWGAAGGRLLPALLRDSDVFTPRACGGQRSRALGCAQSGGNRCSGGRQGLAGSRWLLPSPLFYVVPSQDKNPPERKAECECQFQALSEAYEILSDPKKRREYDRYGAVDGGEEGFSFDKADALFRDFFAGGDPFAGFFDMAGSGFPRGHGSSSGRGGDPFSAGFFDDFGFGRMPAGHGSSSVRGGDPFASVFGAMDNMWESMGDVHMSSSSFHSTSSGFASRSESVRSQTFVRDGRRVTRTTRTVRYPDGREETSTTESVEGGHPHRALPPEHGSRARLPDDRPSGRIPVTRSKPRR